MNYSGIKRNKDGTFTIGPIENVPDISGAATSNPAALFLGPQAENRQMLDDLVAQALQHIYAYRRAYLPGDPETITTQVKHSASYQATVHDMFGAYQELLDFLYHHATPYFSLRYQGHMLWDNALPALVGYFAGMLHNPNNVSIQASTSTTPLAMLVGWDLCSMIGYDMGPDIEPWSHITADGSIANIEATWATRELKYLPLAVRSLLKSRSPEHVCLAPARSVDAALCDGSRIPLLEADEWQLLNIKTDDALALPGRIAQLCGTDETRAVWELLRPYTSNVLGWPRLTRTVQQPPVIIVPSTKHYSWPKAAAVTGFGSKSLIDVFVDADARLEIALLDKQLADCLKRKTPVAMVVAVCGSTEESAVDPIAEILDLREGYRAKGLDFNIHVDAAWGGYMISAIRRDYCLDHGHGAAGDAAEHSFNEKECFLDDVSRIAANDYALMQLKHIRRCDSTTIDPHKWGYVPYPAGSILYRNGAIRRLTTYGGAYIGDSQSMETTEPSVGIFGLEGSRPGASAAAVFLSHRCIRPSISGYGRIINECLFNTRRFYARLLSLNDANLIFRVIPLPRLPAERTGASVAEQLSFVRERILGRTNDELVRDPEAMALFRELGPDQNILDYAFNFCLRDGGLNKNIEQCNRLNAMIYDAFHVGFERHKPLETSRFIVSKTTFARHEYGPAFMDTFSSRLGLEGAPEELVCLRSVVMDPYITHTADGSYFVEIMRIIRETVSEIVTANFGD